MEFSAALEYRLQNVDQRLEANHDSIAKLRDKTGDHDTEIRVAVTELRETREDIKEVREKIVSLTRAFWTASGTLALVFVALATLLVNLASSH